MKFDNETSIIQQKIANSKNLVCEGRDIGTVVFPNADSKFYIDATSGVRTHAGIYAQKFLRLPP